MGADDALPTDAVGWPDTVPLDVRVPVHPRVERTPAVIEDATAWLVAEPLAAEPGRRRFLCDLELRTGPAGRARFRKSAIVTLGGPIRRQDGWIVPVEWQAATFVPLFPVFVGVIEIEPDHLAIRGRYAPPGGSIGRGLDATILHTGATATARWFLGRLEAALA